MSVTAESEITPVEPEIAPTEPESTPTEPESAPRYDSEFINELIEKIDKKLDKKLYYGRKQQKDDENRKKKFENFAEKAEDSKLGFYFGAGFLILVSAAMCYFGLKTLKSEKENEVKH